jgi:hypothetical protein
MKQIVFGLAKRNDSASDPLSIAALYKTMQSGKNLVPQTLARLEEKIDGLIQARARPLATSQSPEELYAERAEDMLDEESHDE